MAVGWPSRRSGTQGTPASGPPHPSAPPPPPAAADPVPSKPRKLPVRYLPRAAPLPAPTPPPRERRPRPPRPWRPTKAQERALRAALQDPSCWHDRAALARVARVSRRQTHVWYADPRFRLWWTTSCAELLRRILGPLAAELRGALAAQELSADARLAYLEAMLAKVCPAVPGVTVAHRRATAAVVLALLEAWLEADGKLAQMDQNASIATSATADALAEDVLEAAAAAGAAAVRAHVREVELGAPDPTMVEHRYTSAPRRPPALAAPTVPPAEGEPRGGMGSKKVNGRPQRQRGWHVRFARDPVPHLWGDSGRCRRCGRARMNKGGGQCRGPQGPKG